MEEETEAPATTAKEVDTSRFPPAYDPASNAEDYDKAGDCKQQAADAKSAGNWEQALELYTQAVLAAPPSALLYANRAMALEQLGQYAAAEHDCQLALELNPDSAKALKVRGKLRYKHLEDWHGALSDLNQAQTMDFDPDLVETLKELTKKRVEEEKMEAQERIQKEEKLKKRASEIKKAQKAAAEEAKEEAQARAAASAGGMGGMPGGMGGMPGGMGGMPGGMGGMGGMPGGMGGMPGGGDGGMPGGMGGMMEMLMKDPELQEAMKNPKVVAAFSEIMSAPGGPMSLMSNPAKMQEMMSDPEVGPVLQKIMGKFMGGGGMPGGMGGGMPGGGSSSKDDDGVPDLGDLPDLD
jgi:suppressor of tumorigenicity protein 13